nr:unnamed protein product [Callosobruchus analis]
MVHLQAVGILLLISGSDFIAARGNYSAANLNGSRSSSLLDDIEEASKSVGRSLSRKRRYLVFPSGSSLQLVYCLTIPSVGVGAIFTFGATAALAWELPSDSEELIELLGKKKGKRTTTEAPTTLPHLTFDDYEHYNDVDNFHQSYYPPDDSPPDRIDLPSYGLSSGSWSPHPTNTFYNPFLRSNIKFGDIGNVARNSISRTTKSQSAGYKYEKYNRNYQRNYKTQEQYVHPVFHEIHRRTRRELYGKIENLLTALSRDGKACLHKAICEVSQVEQGKGTLMEEIFKAIFRIKPHEHYPDEDDYDKAANKNHNCTEMYPTCQHSLWTNMF